jgi:hypothetical protein
MIDRCHRYSLRPPSAVQGPRLVIGLSVDSLHTTDTLEQASGSKDVNGNRTVMRACLPSDATIRPKIEDERYIRPYPG